MVVRTKWTPEQDEVALAYWKRGRSAGMIAKAMGKTRSAVLGRLYRLGVLGLPKEEARLTAVVVGRPKTSPHHMWSEAKLTEKWADRKERLRKERANASAAGA